MKPPKPLKFNAGWLFQDAGQELAAFQQHYEISLPASFIARVWPYAAGLLSTDRKVGFAAERSVWWMILLKLRLPKDCDWEWYHATVEREKMSPIPNPVFHDLISVYLDQKRERFYDSEGSLRFFPFGRAYRFMPRPESLEVGFLCFDVSRSYSVWYLPATKMEEYQLAESFDAMMSVPQRKGKNSKAV